MGVLATSREAIEELYRQRFNDAPPILIIMWGGVVGAGRMSEEAAWELCARSAESGKALQFYEAEPDVDLA